MKSMSHSILRHVCAGALCAVSLLLAQEALAERAIVSKESPTFPSEALDEGIESGVVKVRISVDGSGTVTNVEIVDANPKKIFDKAVKRSVTKWKYASTGESDTIETTLRFQSK
jgi:protein TonB